MELLLLLEIYNGEYHGNLDNISYNPVSCSSSIHKTDEVQIADELWCIEAWVYGSYLRCLSVLPNQIFFSMRPAGCLYNVQRPACSGVYFHTTNLLLSRAGYMQTALNILTHRMCVRRVWGTTQLTRAKTVPGLEKCSNIHCTLMVRNSLNCWYNQSLRLQAHQRWSMGKACVVLTT